MPTQLLIDGVTWLWDKFGKEIIKKAGGSVQGAWKRVQWAEKEHAYRSRLLDHYSTTKLLGNPKDIRIDEIYTDAFVLDKVTAFQRITVEDLQELTGRPEGKSRRSKRREGGLKPRRVPLGDVARREKRLYILGKPGAGKSTFLRHITLLCCRGELPKTPIFVSMKAWADSGLALLEFVDSEFEICGFPAARTFIVKLLESGKALVLFDGLDEVNQEGEKRSKMIKVLTDFARTYPDTQIFVTCRIAATDYSFEKFTYVEVADFTSDQQDQFVRKWYAQTPQRLDRFVEQWNRPENEGLRRLAQTPMLLALMCLAFDETLSFPKRRVEVYEEAISALLKKWDSSRGIVRDAIYRKLSVARKVQLLARIAASTFEQSVFFIPRQNLVKKIEEFLQELPPHDREGVVEVDTVLQSMEVQHGILVERAYGIYAYSHLTLHEYFAARYFVDSAEKSEIVRLVGDVGSNDQWREVIILIASLLDNGDVLLEAFIKKIESLGKSSPGIRDLLKAVHAGARATSKWSRENVEYGIRDLRGEDALWSKMLEATLGIAVELGFSGVTGHGSAIWRARSIASIIQSNPRYLEQWLTNRDEKQHFVVYLRMTHLLLESMNVAISKNRVVYEDRVLGVPGSSSHT